MGFASLLFIPASAIIGLAIAWWKELLTLYYTALIGVGFVFLYFYILTYLRGNFDSYLIKETSRGPCVYYYRNYQGPYPEAISTFHGLFTPAQTDAIYQVRGVKQLSLYWDDSRMLENPNHCRTTTGFMIPYNSSLVPAQILESIGFQKADLPAWKAVESTLESRLEMGYGMAPMKLIPNVCEYCAENYPEIYAELTNEHFIYEICDEDKTIYGIVVDEVRKTMANLAPFKKPTISVKGKRISQEYAGKSKKAK